jgi:ATP-dependent exoDNAse (exonuclease V) alpha subunit
MAFHLTVRLAWHDNNWNGSICEDPKANVYCVGPYSLLSERLARDRDLDKENVNRGKRLDSVHGYIPPCFWSSNSFSQDSLQIKHVHPYPQFSKKTIEETLPAFSSFSWPFRLSFNHTDENKKKDGKYRKDLEDQISNFYSKFQEGESIVFFYLNYSNPISGNESKYALAGCALLKEKGKPTYFWNSFDDPELSEKRRTNNDNKYFPKINWALRLSYDFENSGILLPYQKYWNYVEAHPEEGQKLDSIKVLIDEEGLIERFKYVTESLNDDQSIYLLYKLRKAIKNIQGHGIVNFDREEEKIKTLIKMGWKLRGRYPSLGKILELLVDPDPKTDTGNGEKIVRLVRANQSPGENELEFLFNILQGEENLPDYLLSYRDFISDARNGFRHRASLIGLLKKLSLFNLTKFQLFRIVFPEDPISEMPFGSVSVKIDDIIKNPYLLCEYYVPSRKELDTAEFVDGHIDLSSIDIGMFPDRQNGGISDQRLQNLVSYGPERLRALIVEQLRSIESSGDCFISLHEIYRQIAENPLFYKESIGINEEELVQDRYLTHFNQRLIIWPIGDTYFFYLKEVKEAEDIIRAQITKLIGRRRDHIIELKWLEKFLEDEGKELSNKINGFPLDGFKKERKSLLEGALKNSFMVITGKPGSGKTRAIKKIISELTSKGEEVTLLAPTGKAALRLREETEFQDAQTIDMYLYRNGCKDFLENFELFSSMKIQPKKRIQNLIIDECSMVDLKRLALLLKISGEDNRGQVNRVILIGDENQLPPIGYGRVFYDIVEYLKSKQELRSKHLVHLETNCRQKFDTQILRIADVFMGVNRYYEEQIENLERGGKVSEGFTVDLWRDYGELQSKIDQRLTEIICSKLNISSLNKKGEGLNSLFGLDINGNTPNNDPDNLTLDYLQLITPYKAGFYGTFGLNQYIRQEYKEAFKPKRNEPEQVFWHSDKIIRLTNKYGWDREQKKRDLILSNGSMGVVCGLNYKNWYFPRVGKFNDNDFKDRDEFELAYSITVHKSQGSEFDNVFVIVPKKRSLLSREVIYTALTRSKGHVTLFLEKNDSESLLSTARNSSTILSRNTSLFNQPSESDSRLEPEPGVMVRSRIEFIIYRSLIPMRERGMTFEYERPLKIEGKEKSIHPDFTIWVDGKTYYWEHLGELDQKQYYKDWINRRNYYEITGLSDFLVTTDDLTGIRQESIQRVIEDIISGSLQLTPNNKFSNHHYLLY